MMEKSENGASKILRMSRNSFLLLAYFSSQSSPFYAVMPLAMQAESSIDAAMLHLLVKQPKRVFGAGQSLWRNCECPEDCQRPTMMLSWVLAVSAACLAVGLFGLLRPIDALHQFAKMADKAEAPEIAALTMLELAAPPAAEEVAATEDLPPEVIPQPDVTVEMTPPEVDLEPVPVELTVADVFEVPAAPEIEDMLTPVEPKPKTTPKPTPTTQPRRTTASSPSSGRSSPSGVAGGTPGGTGSSTKGASKGYFPHPPYPAAARSRGMQGTVYVSVSFDAGGRVTGASISRSSGYSDLDRAASDWVRRHWRGPGGQAGTFRQPIQFRLR